MRDNTLTPNSKKPAPSKGRLLRNFFDRQSEDVQHIHALFP